MDYQAYQIVLSPDLCISPEEFAHAWNTTAEARTLAEAHLSEITGAHFFEPVLLTILISVGTGVASNVLTDLIEGLIQRLRDKKGARHTPNAPAHTHAQIARMKQPDGTEMLVVDIDEE